MIASWEKRKRARNAFPREQPDRDQRGQSRARIGVFAEDRAGETIEPDGASSKNSRCGSQFGLRCETPREGCAEVVARDSEAGEPFVFDRLVPVLDSVLLVAAVEQAVAL